MKIWLDDIRTPPGPDWNWVKTAEEAIGILYINDVEEISFDHDLGENRGTGYDVARFIEHFAFLRQMFRIKWIVHSANTVGRNNIVAAMSRADIYWARH